MQHVAQNEETKHSLTMAKNSEEKTAWDVRTEDVSFFSLLYFVLRLLLRQKIMLSVKCLKVSKPLIFCLPSYVCIRYGGREWCFLFLLNFVICGVLFSFSFNSLICLFEKISSIFFAQFFNIIGCLYLIIATE
jgi:hypothetical protein